MSTTTTTIDYRVPLGRRAEQPDTLVDLMRRGRPSVWTSLRILDAMARQLDAAHADGRTHGHLVKSEVAVSERDGVTVHGLELESTLRRHATAAGDRFAFAAIAYELLTGSRGVEAAPPSSLNPALPAAADAILGRALAREPDRRYGSAGALVDHLREALLADLSMDPDGRTLVGGPSEAVAPPRGRTLLLTLALVTILAAATLVAWASLDASLDVAPPPMREVDDIGAPAPPLPPGPAPEELVEGGSGPAPVAMTMTAPVTPATAVSLAPPAEAPASTLSMAPAVASSPTFVDGPMGLVFFREPLPIVGGAVVRSVEPGSAPARAGIEPRDVIVSWAGIDVTGPELLASVELDDPTREVAVVLYREDFDELVERSLLISPEDGR